jgi:hypothetical protein
MGYCVILILYAKYGNPCHEVASETWLDFFCSIFHNSKNIQLPSAGRTPFGDFFGKREEGWAKNEKTNIALSRAL